MWVIYIAVRCILGHCSMFDFECWSESRFFSRIGSLFFLGVRTRPFGLRKYTTFVKQFGGPVTWKALTSFDELCTLATWEMRSCAAYCIIRDLSRPVTCPVGISPVFKMSSSTPFGNNALDQFTWLHCGLKWSSRCAFWKISRDLEKPHPAFLGLEFGRKEKV